MQIYSDKLMLTHTHIETLTHTHALPAKSLLHHLLTHIHNVFLSPAAHQGLGKLPGMKEICSLMAPFHAYGGKGTAGGSLCSQRKGSAVEKANSD